MRAHSAAPLGGKRGPAPSFDMELPAHLRAIHQAALSETALLFAISQVAQLNGNTLRQQVAIWRPFQ